MSLQGTVFVVDDDQSIRESLRRLLESVGFAVETYHDAHAFLAHYRPEQTGCLVLDIRMPGMSGLELQQKLVAERIELPTIVVSGHADVETAVRAMRTGAVDFFMKPYEPAALIECVRHAIAADAARRGVPEDHAAIAARFGMLSEREREVMDLMLAGKSSKQIALELELSSKTVDVHRHNIMVKLQVDSQLELGRLSETLLTIKRRASPAPSSSPLSSR
jgi:two-component system, LuxR family, response regulator FixJ